MYNIRLQAPKPWIIERLDRKLISRGLIFFIADWLVRAPRWR